jgi:hypothetical protein
VTVKPSGARATESPCDIQTGSGDASPARTVEPDGWIVSSVRPNSDSPVRATSPPSACAIAWNP